MHLAAPLNQLLSKTKTRGAGIDTAINVRLCDIQQFGGALQGGDTHHQLHRDLSRFAVLTLKHFAIAWEQTKAVIMVRAGGAFRCLRNPLLAG
ncbi:hypothetical protein D3C80_1964050 [compost metagenome]